MAKTTALKLLHIEDSNDDANFFEHELQNQKNALYTYNVSRSSTLKDALSKLGTEKDFNVILLDLNLPDGHGIDNIEAIKAINTDTPIIIISGTKDEKTALLALKKGAQEYIVKSYSNGPIIQRIIQSSIFRKKAEIELSEKAYCDSLTGLPNRAYFESAARGMLLRAQRNQHKEALMFIDLNKFKIINDTLGHEAGNIVLIEVAKRLKNTLRSSDLVARYAGDEFVIHMDSGKEPVTELLCTHIADKIVREIEKPININGEDLEISLSIGIAIFPNAGKNFDMLLKNADKAMYKAKNSPNKHYVIIGKQNTKAKKSNIKDALPPPDNKNEAEHTVLIIDDSKADRKIYADMMKTPLLNYKILEAASIREGVRLLETNTPECILLDNNLPDSTGIDFLLKCKETGKDLNAAIVMITGQADRDTAIECMKNGAKDYIVKGEIDPSRFAQTIFNAIEKHRLENEVKAYQQELERSNRDLTDFSQTVAHDLKAPMRKVFMFCEILAEETSSIDNPNVANCINRMSVSASRMQTLVNNLLEYAQITHGVAQKEPACLNTIALEIVDDLETWLQENNATVTIKQLPKWPVQSVQIRQLLTNLITNAVKYKDTDRDANIVISAHIQDETCTINVKDNGMGIAREQISKIFKPFHRLHTADDIEGTGLGLAICQKIVERHGGQISLESKIKEGSIFTFHLPS